MRRPGSLLLLRYVLIGLAILAIEMPARAELSLCSYVIAPPADVHPFLGVSHRQNELKDWALAQVEDAGGFEAILAETLDAPESAEPPRLRALVEALLGKSLLYPSATARVVSSYLRGFVHPATGKLTAIATRAQLAQAIFEVHGYEFYLANRDSANGLMRARAEHWLASLIIDRVSAVRIPHGILQRVPYEEIISHLTLRVMTGIQGGTVRDGFHLSGAISVVARNAPLEILRHGRTNGRDKGVSLEEPVSDSPGLTLGMSLVSPDRPQGLRMELDSELALFARISYFMGEKHRQTLALTIFEGLEGKEIAQLMGMSGANADVTVRSNKRKGLAVMKEMFERMQGRGGQAVFQGGDLTRFAADLARGGDALRARVKDYLLFYWGPQILRRYGMLGDETLAPLIAEFQAAYRAAGDLRAAAARVKVRLATN